MIPPYRKPMVAMPPSPGASAPLTNLFEGVRVVPASPDSLFAARNEAFKAGQMQMMDRYRQALLAAGYVPPNLPILELMRLETDTDAVEGQWSPDLGCFVKATVGGR